jgi:hypothetical protein
MKKSALTVALVVALLCSIFALRGERPSATDLSAAEQTQSAKPTEQLRNPRRASASQRKAIEEPPRVSLVPGIAAPTVKAADEVMTWPSSEEIARDGYYDRLLGKQGRDQAKEEQILSRLMAVFGSSPDTLVGSASCSAQFCRIELRGVGKVDVRERWHQDIVSAVEPKGLRFYVVDHDADGNTIANCYFGRDESWTVPDFNALGML